MEKERGFGIQKYVPIQKYFFVLELIIPALSLTEKN